MYDQDNLIEKKLDGTLTSEELQRFEVLLETDPAFAQAYATQREMITALREHYKADLHQQLKAGYRMFQKDQRQRRYYGIAAAVLLTIVAGWFWYSIDQTLFNQYYQPYEVVVYRGPSSAADKAIVYYNQEQYTEAIPLLRTLKQSKDNVAYWTLLLGNAYLQLDSTSQATEQFMQVAERSTNKTYTQYGRWYLAMSYLQDEDITSAREALQPIAQQSGLFQQKAQQLLQEL